MKARCVFCFDRFHSGNFDLNIEPRSQSESKINNNDLESQVEENSSHTTSKLARLILLRQIGKIKKLAIASRFWLPYELIEQQHQKHVEATQFREF